MKRSAALLPLVALMGMLSTPAAEAADLFRTTFKGGVALAVWTTCPDPVVGQICQETVVIASDSATTEQFPEGRERDRGPRVVLQRFLFEVVDPDDEVSRPILESFGGTDEAIVDIDRRSRFATASAAAIPMNTTRYRETSVVFDDVVSLDVEWDGEGDLRAIDERDMFNDRTVLARSWTKGWERSASARGEVDGRPILGSIDASGTTLINVRQGELRLFKRP